jgi:hypothetical protein
MGPELIFFMIFFFLRIFVFLCLFLRASWTRRRFYARAGSQRRASGRALCGFRETQCHVMMDGEKDGRMGWMEGKAWKQSGRHTLLYAMLEIT